MNRENPLLTSVKNKLRYRFEEPQFIIHNPFSEKNYLTKRMFEGYYGPLASMDRSIAIEEQSHQLVRNISDSRDNWKKEFSRKKKAELNQIKEVKVKELQEKWQEIPKGGIEEESWLTEAAGFVTAYFENNKKNQGEKIKMWDNQLLYLTLMNLEKGKYSFGELSTVHRAIQLDTGEGKTKCTGLVAVLNILQGKEVIIVEQNYISAEKHAQELYPFFEDLLSVETGVVIDRSYKGKGTAKNVRVNSYGIIEEDGEDDFIKNVRVGSDGIIREKKQSKASLRKSYVYSNGEKIEDSSQSGRQRCWKKRIVYCDHNSLGTDVATDRQLTTKKKDQLVPDLKNKVGLIQEADGLAIDEAANPFQIQIPASGDAAWYLINQLFYSPAEVYLESKRGKKNKDPIKEVVRRKPTEKRADIEFTKDFYFGLFDGLYSIVNTNSSLADEWKNRKAYIITTNQRFIYDESVVETAIDKLAPFLAPLFKNDEKICRDFLFNNAFIVDTALEVLMTGQPGRGFISGEKPILMDQYGVPLDNRQKDKVYQVFLQLYNIWEKEGLTKKSEITDEDVKRARKKTHHQIEVPFKISNKIIPSVLYREFGELRLTSGTLIPITKPLFDLYNTETLAVSRHEAIAEPNDVRKGLRTVCLDGGIAEVDFVEKQRLAGKIHDLIKNIQKKGTAGLIIMPDAKSAYELNQLLADFFADEVANDRKWEDLIMIDGAPINERNINNKVRLVTGDEEFAIRGTLEKTLSDINPGDIIITTQMAHRDIDPELSKQVKKNGGLTTVVYNPPNERGLWQALQRSVRANVKGERMLLLSEDSVKDIRNLYLINPPTNQPISSLIVGTDVLRKERQQEIDTLFTKSLKGDLKSQQSLFNQYLLGLRNSEGQVTDSIMFSMVRELPLKDMRENIFSLIGEKGMNIFENYINLISYAFYKKHYPKIVLNQKTVDAFIDLAGNEQRDELLKNIGLYGSMEFMQNKEIIRKAIFTTFWSDLLEMIDYLYRDFQTRQMGSDVQHHSYIQYQGGWKKYLKYFIQNDLDLRPYFLGKIEDLEI
ncbi:hypothetical protein CANDROIZ_240003 [Candidatus Roizmanbacteria bacterium]|nr:hypothetical protein CANDROIZ_240003 [Candidatus Roizmanbacteria bacterium]